MTDITPSPRPPLVPDSLVGQCVLAAIEDLHEIGPGDRWIEEITRSILLTASTYLIARQQCAGQSLTLRQAVACLVEEAS